MPDGDAVQFQSPTTGAVQPVPPEHWDEAMQQGYKPTTHKVMYSPDGKRGMVPNEQLRDYMQQGYQTTPKTQFEKDRPGKGITTEGMGGAAWDTAKRMVPSDPTGGASPLSREFWLGKPGSFGIDPAKGSLAEAGREVAAGWKRGHESPLGTLSPTEQGAGEAIGSGVGSLFGISGRQQYENAKRGEGGKIIGETGLPLAALAAPSLLGRVAPPLVRSGRGLAGKAIIGQDLEPRPAARLVLGKERASALGDVLNPDYAKMRGAQDVRAARVEMDADLAKQAEQHGDRLREIEDARQKELADQEKLKEQHAQSLMRRQAQQDRLDAAHKARLEELENDRQKELTGAEQFKEQHAQSLMRRQAGQNAIDRQAARPENPTSRIIQPGTPEAQPPAVAGSYWSFDRQALHNAVLLGDRDAAIVYKQRFGELPPGASYLTDVGQGPTRGLYRGSK